MASERFPSAAAGQDTGHQRGHGSPRLWQLPLLPTGTTSLEKAVLPAGDLGRGCYEVIGKMSFAPHGCHRVPLGHLPPGL